MEKSANKLRPALLGGILIGVIGGIPFLNFINCMCCMGVIGGGVLSAYLFYKDSSPEYIISVSDGALLGFLSGLFGTFISIILHSFFGPATFNVLYKISATINDPDLQALIDNFNPRLLENSFILLDFALNLVVNTIFGLLGGIIGVSIWSSRKNVPAN